MRLHSILTCLVVFSYCSVVWQMRFILRSSSAALQDYISLIVVYNYTTNFEAHIAAPSSNGVILWHFVEWPVITLGHKRAAWLRLKWKTFSALLALCKENPPVTGGFPSKHQWGGALMFSLICAWANRWANNRDADELRRHCAHYDVAVMCAI